MSLESCLTLIDAAASERVLYAGETIIDEYRFGSVLARPPKEPVLALRTKKSEVYQGGVAAAFAHGRNFCQAGQITTGNKIRKIRFIEDNYARKMFEAQEIEDGDSKDLLPAEILARYWTLAACDFGHGMFTPAVIEQLAAWSGFLCVAVQSNAANAGFNLLTKYPRADYAVIDEPEARLAAADRRSGIEAIMRKLAAERFGTLIVTHGKHGAYGLRGDEFLHVPTHSSLPLDTMGAGDAFFAVTAPMARDGALEDLLTIGCAAGALKTQILGHQKAVTKDALIDYLKTHATR